MPLPNIELKSKDTDKSQRFRNIPLTSTPLSSLSWWPEAHTLAYPTIITLTTSWHNTDRNFSNGRPESTLEFLNYIAALALFKRDPQMRSRQVHEPTKHLLASLSASIFTWRSFHYSSFPFFLFRRISWEDGRDGKKTIMKSWSTPPSSCACGINQQKSWSMRFAWLSHILGSLAHMLPCIRLDCRKDKSVKDMYSWLAIYRAYMRCI